MTTLEVRDIFHALGIFNVLTMLLYEFGKAADAFPDFEFR